MKIKGYGVELFATEWANLLGMQTTDFLYYVDNKGLTIEELFDLRGPKYKPPRPRKPRESKQMTATRDRINYLLKVSQIAEGIEVLKAEAGTTLHILKYQGEPFGEYNYKTGALRLSGGEWIPLQKLRREDAKVERGEDGLWYAHRDTRVILIVQDVRAKQKMKEEVQAFYQAEEKAAALRREQEELSRKTYEGFGKSFTCTVWARVLGVSKNTLWYSLQRGETIEEFAQRRGIKL